MVWFVMFVGVGFGLDRYVYKEGGEARCLDGTVPPIYQHLPTTIYSYNILIMLQPISYSLQNTLEQTFKALYLNSKTKKGSSKQYPESLQIPGIFEAYSSWSQFFIPSCDGLGHQGYLQSPISYNNTQLYIRGRKNTELHFQYIKSLQIYKKANKIVLIGSEAGGIAAMQFSSLLKPHYTIVDSSYLVYNKSSPFYSNLITFQNYLSIPTQCTSQYKIFDCFFYDILSKYVQKDKLFLVTSLYSTNMLLQQGYRCIQKGIQQCFKQGYRYGIQQNVARLKKVEGYGWMVACVGDSFVNNTRFGDSNYSVPERQNQTVAKVIQLFLSNKSDIYNYRHIDTNIWPLNQRCSNLMSPSNNY